MESIEQPVFDSISSLGHDPIDTADRTELIDGAGKKKNSKSEEGSNQESSPLHQPEAPSNVLCSPQNYGLRVIIISSIVFAAGTTMALVLTIYLAPKEISGNAAVVAEDQRCASLGLKALENGGNAVDAAVTAGFCLAVVEPQNSGIGGGGFAIVHDHKFGKSYAYNFRETVPSGANTALFENLADSSIQSSGVPGMVKGLATMHKKHGKLPWKDVVRPSVELARNGFAVSKELAQSLKKNHPAELHDSGFFTDETGDWKSSNDSIVFTALARTLELIQNEPDTMYTGLLKFELSKEIASKKGIITEQDLINYKVTEPKLLKTKIKDLTMLTMPPPAAGPLLALIMNMVQKFPKTPEQEDRNNSLTYHGLIETFKFAFAQLTMLGDPDFEETMEWEISNLISDTLASKLVGKIGNETHTDQSFYGPVQIQNKRGTSHISVLDSAEVMVSMTLSTGNPFGNKVLLPKSGILLNDNLMEFSLPSFNPPADDRNKPRANKRPQSSMCPAIIYNEDHPCDKRLVIGAVHGPNVITGLSQTIINNLLFDYDLPKALSNPRLHQQLFPSYTEYEEGFPEDFVEELKKRGHEMKKVVKVASEVSVIRKSNDDITEGIDPRSLSAEDHY